MDIRDLIEARRNPTANDQNRHSAAIDTLFQWIDRGEYYATFTSLPKVGINPKSAYATPIGVYCYPLFAPQIAEQIEHDALPFAGDAPYINVMKATSPMVHLQGGEATFTRITDLVTKWLAARLPIYRDLSGPPQHIRMAPDKLEYFIGDAVYAYAKMKARVKTPGGIWWSYTRIAALLIRYINDPETVAERIEWKVRDLGRMCDSADHLAKVIKNASPVWTRLMTDIGVAGCVDIGDGIIHTNEPTQAVFFAPSAIKVVDRMANPRNSQDRKTINLARDLFRVLNRSAGSLNANTLFMILKWVAKPNSDNALFNIYGLNVEGKSETTKIKLEPTEDDVRYFVAAATVVKSPRVTQSVRDQVLHMAVAQMIESRKAMSRAEQLWRGFVITILGPEKGDQYIRDWKY